MAPAGSSHRQFARVIGKSRPQKLWDRRPLSKNFSLLTFTHVVREWRGPSWITLVIHPRSLRQVLCLPGVDSQASKTARPYVTVETIVGVTVKTYRCRLWQPPFDAGGVRGGLVSGEGPVGGGGHDDVELAAACPAFLHRYLAVKVLSGKPTTAPKTKTKGADSTAQVHFSSIPARRGKTPGSNRSTAGCVMNCSTHGASTRCARPPDRTTPTQHDARTPGWRRRRGGVLRSRRAAPTGRGRARWAMRWKPALNAFAITFNGRITPTGN